jgi:hypothetical protein
VAVDGDVAQVGPGVGGEAVGDAGAALAIDGRAAAVVLAGLGDAGEALGGPGDVVDLGLLAAGPLVVDLDDHAVEEGAVDALGVLVPVGGTEHLGIDGLAVGDQAEDVLLLAVVDVLGGAVVVVVVGDADAEDAAEVIDLAEDGGGLGLADDELGAGVHGDGLAVEHADGGKVVDCGAGEVLGGLAGIVHDRAEGPHPDQVVALLGGDRVEPAGADAGLAVLGQLGAGLGDGAVLGAELPVLRTILEGVGGAGEVVAEAHRVSHLVGDDGHVDAVLEVVAHVLGALLLDLDGVAGVEVAELVLQRAGEPDEGERGVGLLGVDDAGAAAGERLFLHPGELLADGGVAAAQGGGHVHDAGVEGEAFDALELLDHGGHQLGLERGTARGEAASAVGGGGGGGGVEGGAHALDGAVDVLDLGADGERQVQRGRHGGPLGAGELGEAVGHGLPGHHGEGAAVGGGGGGGQRPVMDVLALGDVVGGELAGEEAHLVDGVLAPDVVDPGPDVDAGGDDHAGEGVDGVGIDAPGGLALGGLDRVDLVVAQVAAAHVEGGAAGGEQLGVGGAGLVGELAGVGGGAGGEPGAAAGGGIGRLDGAVAEDDDLRHLGEGDDAGVHVALAAERRGEVVAVLAGVGPAAAALVDLAGEEDGVLEVVLLAEEDGEAGEAVLGGAAGVGALGVLRGTDGGAETDVPHMRGLGRGLVVVLVAEVGHVPGNGDRLALAVGERALLAEGIALGAAADGLALVLGAVAVGVAVGVLAVPGGRRGVALDGAGHAGRVGVVVGALPDLVVAEEAVPVVVGHAVVAGVAPAIDVEAAVGLEAVAVPVLGLEVAVDDAAEGLADGELHRVAAGVGEAAAHEVAVEPAGGDEAEAPAEEADVDHAGDDEGLVGDVEVAVIDVEHRRVRIVGSGDVVGEGLVGDVAVDAEQRQGVEVVGVGGEVLRPVDADVLALVPRPVDGVLLEHVDLLARGRVVLPDDVEVALDGIGGDDDAVLRGAADTAAVGVVDPLVGQPGNEQVLGDLEADAGDGLGVGRREQAVLRRAVADVDQGALRPELGIVGRTVEVLADEERLRQRVRLDPIDGGPFVGASGDGEQSRECGGNDQHPAHHVPRLLRSVVRCPAGSERRDLTC